MARTKRTPIEMAAKQMAKNAKTEVKEAAVRKEESKDTVTFEFGGKKILAKDVLEKAKKAFAEKNKDVEIKNVNLYIVAEENAAYYVVNGMQSEEYKIEL